MTPEQFRQVEDIFHRGKDLLPAEQGALLDAECGDDAEVRAEVEKLLAQADPEETLADLKGRVNRVLRPGVDDPSAAAGGPVIEGYDILREIERGGQGVVYQAVQEHTKRKVAIKVLLAGPYASKSARRRFEREIELVAQLKHPNIVSIFHSGQTSDDQQYYVMDYVHGVPLDQYVRNERLTLEDALKLFATVCEAVNYAHQKGMIHRDLKPSNILVDADGEPKVLDFGLAKQLVSREASLISLTGQVVGTLPYMSPEQAEGDSDKIDIRTDVYALGVILYQMLTGQYPYPVAGKMADILKHIAETEPTPPSRSWKSESGVTKRTNKRIRPGQCPIDDEVQTIVLRTLAKERERRYQSAGELAKDVAHYLADEPIEAKRDSGWYVLKKHMRHYRLPIALAATFVAVITVSLVVSVSLWRQAERDRAVAVLAEQEQSSARQEADEQRKLAEEREKEATEARAESQERADELEIVTTFQQSMLSEIDAEEMGRALFADLHDRVRESLKAEEVSREDLNSALEAFIQTLRRANATDAALTLIDEQILSRAVKAIERDFASQPLVRAALQQTVADIYRETGRYPPAMPLQKAALQTRRIELGDDHPGTLESVGSMGALLELMGMLTEAEPFFREALEGKRRVLGDDHLDTLESMNNMGYLLLSAGKLEEAQGYFHVALEGSRRVLGDNDPRTLTSISNTGDLLHRMGKLGEAEPYIREALEGTRRVLGDDHPETLGSIANMGALLHSMGNLSEAEPYYREALAASRRVLGNDHPSTLNSISNLAALLNSMGKLSEAEPYYREALERRRRMLGGDHPDTLTSINNMGALLKGMGKFEEALSHFRKALAGYRRVLGDDHPSTLTSIGNFGALLILAGKPTEAEPYFSEALERSRRVLGDDHPGTLRSINNMGRLLGRMGKLSEAEPYHRQALAGYRRVLGDDHPSTLTSINGMGVLLQSMGKLTEAESYFREALAGYRRVLGDDHPSTLTSINDMGMFLNSMGKLDEAQGFLLEALESRRRTLGDDHPSTLISINNMGFQHQKQGNLADAEPYYREALEGTRRVLGDQHPKTLISIHNMGRLLRDLGRLEEAEALGAEAVRGVIAKLARSHPFRLAALAQHGRTLAAMDRFSEAEPELLEANEGFTKSHGADHSRTIDTTKALVALYESWNTAKPEAGYDVKAAEWRAKLPAATSQPVATQPAASQPTTQPAPQSR